MSNSYDEVIKKRKKLYISILIATLFFMAYFYYYVSKGSLVWKIYSVFVVFLMAYMLRSLLKKKDNKDEDIFKEEDFLGNMHMDYSIKLFMSSYVGIFYIAISIISTIFEKISSYRNLHLAIYIITLIALVLVFLYFVKRYSYLSTLLYEEGIRIYNRDILFNDIKKFNFLKLKASGYYFEVNLAGDYYRFTVSEEQRDMILNNLPKAMI